LGHLGPLGAGEALAITTFDALLADPVAERLFDAAELSRHIRDGAVLIKNERRRVATELFGIATSTPGWPL
jgi:hypothetical protein